MDRLRQIQSDPAANVIPDSAECLAMCDPISNDRQNSHFEFDQEGFKSFLAVKKFGRSDAGHQMNEPCNIRPPEVLYLSMTYLRDCIADQDLVPPGQSFFQYKDQMFGEMDDIS